MMPDVAYEDMDPEEIRVLEHLAGQLRKATPEVRKEVLAQLDAKMVQDLLRYMSTKLTTDKKKVLAKAAQALAQAWKPKDDEELWRFLKDECGLAIPRTAVCEGCCSPFSFAADVYFERGNNDKLAIGNRGSGKTQILGAVHALNARTKPKHEGATVGAIEQQAKKCYSYFREIVLQDGWQPYFDERKIQMGGSHGKNGAKVQVIIGTMTGVNSPHPQFAHFDEIELFRPGVFEEALNMAQSKDGYRAMNVLTSSWKKPRGPVTRIVDDAQKAAREGHQSEYQIYKWCVFETTQTCEYDCSMCPFADVVKGKWEDGTPRTFESVCKRGSTVPDQGKLKRAEGFVSMEDTVARFKKLSRRVWEAQQESKRPSTEGLVYDCFDEDIHTVSNWEPDPELGPITIGIDFGGTNPHAVGFWQELNVEVETPEGRRLTEGSHVCFDEIYVTDIGNVELGKRINERIITWELEQPGFIDAIDGIYCDPAAKAARTDLRRLRNYGEVDDPVYTNIVTHSVGGTKVEDRVAHVYEIIADDKLYLDKERCSNHLNEMLSYEYPNNGEKINKGKPRKEFDHTMDAMGYRFWCIHVAAGRTKQKLDKPTSIARPRAVQRKDDGTKIATFDPTMLGVDPEKLKGHTNRRSKLVHAKARRNRRP